jgi:hypothetical protein
VRTEHKADEGGFSLAHFNGDERRRADVQAVYALGLDCDDGSLTLEHAAVLLASYRALLYTTHSSMPSAPRWRAVVLFSRPVTAAEYDAIWSHAARHIGAAGIELDGATKDPSRLWYVPAAKPEAQYRFRGVNGAPLDVDALLAAASAERPEPPRSPPTDPTPGPSAHRVRRYLAKMDPAISGAGGHCAAFRVACFIVANASDPSEQEALFAEYNTRCKPPWSRRELAHKLEDARKRPGRPLEARP